jgi:hypothetical protein
MKFTNYLQLIKGILINEFRFALKPQNVRSTFERFLADE